METEAFEKIVRDALTELPKEFKDKLNNLDIIIKDWPDEGDYDDADQKNLLGLYTGVPLTERSYSFAFPDKITIYKNPLLRISRDEKDIIKHVKQTVRHEIGHHFGLSDEELYRIETKQ